MFNTQEFQIYRLETTSGNKKSYSDSGELIFGNLEPVDAEFAAIAGSTYGKSFKLFSTNMETTLTEADRLICGAESFEVKGVQKFNHPPRHVEAVVEKMIKQ